MNYERKYRYLRLVLHLISKRKWKNGYITKLAAEAIRRTQAQPKVTTKKARPKHRQKTPTEIEATRRVTRLPREKT